MAFPWVVLASPAELPVGAFDGPVPVAGSAVGSAPCGYGKKTEIHRRIDLPLDSGLEEAAATDGPAVAGVAEDDPRTGGTAARASDAPPRMLT